MGATEYRIQNTTETTETTNYRNYRIQGHILKS